MQRRSDLAFAWVWMWEEKMSARVPVLAVNMIVFWLGLSGAPSSGLVEILAALTSPLLSQFDSWWDLRWSACVRAWGVRACARIASNIHNNLISLSPSHPSTPHTHFYSTPLPPLYFTVAIGLALLFTFHSSAFSLQHLGTVLVQDFTLMVPCCLCSTHLCSK